MYGRKTRANELVLVLLMSPKFSESFFAILFVLLTTERASSNLFSTIIPVSSSKIFYKDVCLLSKIMYDVFHPIPKKNLLNDVCYERSIRKS